MKNFVFKTIEVLVAYRQNLPIICQNDVRLIKTVFDTLSMALAIITLVTLIKPIKSSTVAVVGSPDAIPANLFACGYSK